MAVNAYLLGTSTHEIQASWTGPDELKQSKLCFMIFMQRSEVSLCGTPSESPKVMGLVGIHDPDALHHFGGITHCPWCGKEGQNKGTMVNHL